MRAVADCLPGAFVDATPSPERVEGGIKVGLGPITASFRGVAAVTREEASRSGRILGAGADGRSGAQGEIRYRVEPGAQAGTSEIVMQVGYTLKGPLAQFGRPGLVRDIAARLTAEFAKNLEARLSGAPVQAGGQAPAGGLNPFRLVAALIGDWLKRLRSGGAPR
ncbi:SRPBCC domain-containing protein [Chenggangzhangella methanolivorans]|uniref:SRPBCC domain-containing protein n=1 Tax=Chenggangzhangella methanolivorans TaxID=1437009 RepID=UPI0021BD9610|nr:SRPBCC domain-containing protein [Chenggangzhangella methanolivorans]